MLGQVAADAMKKAVSGHGTNKKKATDEGWDDMMKDVERRRAKPAVGSVERGAKHDIEHTATGRRVTRRTDDQGISVGADDDSSADAPKRGRGRPKGTGGKMGAKGPSGKSKLMTKEGTGGDDLVKLAKVIASCKTPEQLEAARKMAKNFLNKHAGTDRGAMMGRDAAVADIDRKKKELSGEELEEKAVSKKQQKFMGMVHAAQKGEKPASKEVAKVAKEMPKKAAKDFASTKHKGLPEKAPKKEDGADKSAEKPKKKKEKTEEAGGSGTPTASSGFSFGKGIYDSINRELEEMIAESMNVSMNMNNDAHGGPTKSLTVTATDEDAEYLGKLLKMAGVGGDQGGCGCGTSPCSCGDQMDETYGDTTATENAPDYPTDTETSDDALQYSGGLNKPKSTGQTTVPVIASQEERQESYAEAEEDAIKRMMEMAGIKTEGKKVEEDDVEEGNKFTGNLAKARAAGKKEADLDGDGDMEKVQESIFALTNMWKEYKAK
jgi:hypothetical protein